ncbi:MAG: divergent polysaccharide deacetylase family protein [Candidatus Omnitrophica bacterium]|nr:divergent polysaccharide deacetylase family protein [Candidatus Omnitrophota bacterium]
MRKSKIFYITISFFILGIVLFLFIFQRKDYSPLARECDQHVLKILIDNHTDINSPLSKRQKLTKTFTAVSQLIEKEFLVDSPKKLTTIKDEVIRNEALKKFRLGEITTKKTDFEKTAAFSFYYKKFTVYRLKLTAKLARAKVAIVLDDWGYNKKLFESTLELDTPMTYAILPNLIYSEHIAAELRKRGGEFILHLPLEPKNTEQAPLEKNTLMTTMNEEEITRILKEDIANLSGIKGANNHMGSKATEEGSFMKIVMDTLKENNLYFLDSYTSDKSIAEKVAKEIALPFLKRDIFIDSIPGSESIKQKMYEVKRIALISGEAIAIGHARHTTISAIKELIPEFKRDGIKFVYLSSLLNSSGDEKQTPNFKNILLEDK